jgi:predicted TIM-barrel fold metal-dependent hydrolase
MPPFRLIDAHMHQWDPRATPRESSAVVRLMGRTPRLMGAVAQRFAPAPTRQAVGRFDYVLAPYLPDDYAVDGAAYAVDGVVHVEAGWAGRGPLASVAETVWVSELGLDGLSGPRLLAIVARADLTAPDAARELDAHLAASPLVRGVRQTGAAHPDRGIRDWAGAPGRYRSSAFLRGFEQLASRGLSFDALVYSWQLGDVTALASRFPEVPIVLCHLGTPAGLYGPVGRGTGRTERDRAGILAAWREDLAVLAGHRHVYAKVSGLLEPILGHGESRPGRGRLTRDQIVERVAPVIDHAVATFTPARLMVASNFPMDKVTASLTDILGAYADVLDRHGEAARRAVFEDTARRFYRVD